MLLGCQMFRETLLQKKYLVVLKKSGYNCTLKTQSSAVNTIMCRWCVITCLKSTEHFYRFGETKIGYDYDSLVLGSSQFLLLLPAD